MSTWPFDFEKNPYLLVLRPKNQNSPTTGTKWTHLEINFVWKMISLEYYVFSLWCHIFANRPKCGFPGNRSKMHQLQKIRKSSELVIRGWYMTHFDRRDLLHSKKQVWGGYRNYSDLLKPICEFSMIFSEIPSGAAGPRK